MEAAMFMIELGTLCLATALFGLKSNTLFIHRKENDKREIWVASVSGNCQSFFIVSTGMRLIQKFKTLIHQGFAPPVKEMRVEEAYDKWAGSYDLQPDNLILAVDTAIFRHFTRSLLLKDAQIVDVGCGTGRYWSYLYNGQPASLTGYDVSSEMLKQLQQKFPAANIYKQENHLLQNNSNSVDLLMSTLTMAHLSGIETFIEEWCRVVKPGGNMILTDYHPVALANDAKRTFSFEGKQLAVESRIYPVDAIIAMAKKYGMQLVDRIEKQIDETMLDWYIRQNAVPVYEKYKGTPIVYGLSLQKTI